MPGLDEDVDDPAAHAIGVDSDLISEVDHHHARLFIGHDFQRRAPDLGLAAATTDGAVGRPIRFDQHARADLAG